ncbi:response regulator [Pedobacter arcticus]|uniref:response regulator n=1 Tax=Pedobacter arcticus TaxID=752140 RepID=UPI0002FA5A34|nr:response regulator [Pedobacter arcticus]
MQKTNILIVDDREENIIALTALIQRADVNIITTTSPNEALKLAWENNIAIALVDVQMPDIDGFELVDMLKANPRTKDILVIFVTAISKESKYAVKGYNAGGIDYLYKPLDPYITAAKVDSFIQLATAQNLVKQKNEELENFAIVINNCADIICAIDAKNLRIKTASQAVEKVIGYKQVEFVDKKITDFVDQDLKQDFIANLNKIPKSKITTSFETRFVNFTGEKIWFECRVTFKADIFFLNASNISHQKEYATELIQAKDEALKAKKVKEVFLANMSHELRTPINGIIGISNLLQNTELTAAQLEMIKLLEISSQSLLGVVNDILDISKIESGKFSIVNKDINLKELLKSVTDILRFKADEKLIELKLEISPEVPHYIIADALRLNQILMNLLSNAIKFTNRGKVTLRVTKESMRENAVNLKFEVIDTGIGIPKNRLANVFESYEQADEETAIKYGGTGLGLTIVKKLVGLMNGELSVESVVGHGSVFTFTASFKLHQDNAGLMIKFNQGLTPFKGIKILIAEDNLVNQFMVNKILKSWEVETYTVDTGFKAVEILQKQDFDLILMDTHMPEMGGFEATRKIRSEFQSPKKDIKIISLSAAILEEEKEAALAAGMNEILTKPFVLEDLHRIISKVLVV